MMARLRAFLCWGLLAAALSVSGPAAGEQRALLVGIATYKNPQVNLGSKEKDLDRILDILTRHWDFRRDEISVLQDARATKRNILRTFRSWLIDSTRPGDRVVFYYSGHGSQVPDRNGDEKDGQDETLSPHDTGVESKQLTNQVTDDEVHGLLAQLEGRSVTLIIDSCHSGTISRAFASQAEASEHRVRTIIPPSAAAVSRGAVEANRVEEAFVRASSPAIVWSAATAGQLSYENGGEGTFTKAFWEGSAGRRADRNANGVVTNAELLDYTRGETQKYCQASETCRRLGFTPQLEAPAAAMVVPFVPIGASPATQAEAVTDSVGGGNEAGLTLEMLPSAKVRLGEPVKFRLTGKKAGWLVLLDVNAAGQVVQIFPNDIATNHGSDGKIRAGEPLTIPDPYYGFEFTASEPAGKGTLVAIVTEDQVALEELLKPHGNLEPIADPSAYMAALAQKLRSIWTGEQANRELRWSMTELPYEIVR
jgi:hypothetical protein